MKKTVITILVAVALVLLGFFLGSSASPHTKSSEYAAPSPDPRTTPANAVLPAEKKVVPPVGLDSPFQHAADVRPSASGPVVPLIERLRQWQQDRGDGLIEARSESLEVIKHEVALNIPELPVSEIIRDAQVSTVRLNKHSGKLYKFAGLI